MYGTSLLWVFTSTQGDRPISDMGVCVFWSIYGVRNDDRLEVAHTDAKMTGLGLKKIEFYSWLCFLPAVWNWQVRWAFWAQFPYLRNERAGLDRRLANCGSQDKSGLPPVPVNNILAKPSHFASLCLSVLVSSVTAVVMLQQQWVVARDTVGPTKTKIFLF